ncbi:hypothetical protein ACQKL6_00960 [Peribacillus sp. NPDC097197]|uniref:hypothetical protein n=1 Tax=Peribacillus sp. NPDC097197 TaxID=3390615 RepID=UPI003CFFFAC4
MKELDWFVKTLENEFHIEADKRQISYEGSELYLDEIDELLIPPDMLNGLPEPFLFETMVFDREEDGTEWLGIIAMNIGTREWHLQLILKNEEVVYKKEIKKERD